jgi:hypothetical protein
MLQVLAYQQLLIPFLANRKAELAVAPLIILASKLHENRGRSLLSCPYG